MVSRSTNVPRTLLGGLSLVVCSWLSSRVLACCCSVSAGAACEVFFSNLEKTSEGSLDGLCLCGCEIRYCEANLFHTVVILWRLLS
jgi:hypothetical protein